MFRINNLIVFFLIISSFSLYAKDQVNTNISLKLLCNVAFSNFDNFTAVLAMNIETIIKVLMDKGVVTREALEKAADEVAEEVKTRNEEIQAEVQSTLSSEPGVAPEDTEQA